MQRALGLPRDIWHKIIDDYFFTMAKTRTVISALSKQFRKLILQYELERLYQLDHASQLVTLARITSYFIALDQQHAGRIGASAVLAEIDLVSRLDHYMRRVVPADHATLALGILNRLRGLTHAERIHFAEAGEKSKEQKKRLALALCYPRHSTLVYLFPALNRAQNQPYRRLLQNLYQSALGDERSVIYTAKNRDLIYYIVYDAQRCFKPEVLASLMRKDLTNYTKEDLAVDYRAFLGANNQREVLIDKFPPADLSATQVMALLPLLLDEMRHRSENLYEYSEVILRCFLERLTADQTSLAFKMVVNAFPDKDSLPASFAVLALPVLAIRSPELIDSILAALEYAASRSRAIVKSYWHLSVAPVYDKGNQAVKVAILAYWLRSWFDVNLVKMIIPADLAFDLTMSALREEQHQWNAVKFDRLVMLAPKMNREQIFKVFNELYEIIIKINDPIVIEPFLNLMITIAELIATEEVVIPKILQIASRPLFVEFERRMISKIGRIILSAQPNLQQSVGLKMLALLQQERPSEESIADLVKFTMVLVPDPLQFVIPLLIRLSVDSNTAIELFATFNITACHGMVGTLLQHLSSSEIRRDLMLLMLFGASTDFPLIFSLVRLLCTTYQNDSNKKWLQSVFINLIPNLDENLPATVMFEHHEWLLNYCFSIDHAYTKWVAIDRLLALVIRAYQSQIDSLVVIVESIVLDDRLLNDPTNVDFVRLDETTASLKKLFYQSSEDARHALFDLGIVIGSYYKNNNFFYLPQGDDPYYGFQLWQLYQAKQAESLVSTGEAEKYLRKVIKLYGYIEEERIIALLLPCLRRNFEYPQKINKALLEIFVHHVDRLQRDDVQALIHMAYRCKENLHFLIPLLPRFTDDEITKLINRLHYIDEHDLATSDIIMSMVAACKEFFVTTGKDTHLALLATVPAARAVVSFPCAEMGNRLTSARPVTLFFLNACIEKPVCRFGQDLDSLLAAMLDYFASLNTSRMSPDQKSAFTNCLFSSFLTEQRADLSMPLRVALCMLVATVLANKWEGASLSNFCKHIEWHTNQLNPCDIITVLAQTNHIGARYALIYLLERCPSQAETYIKAYCQSVRDPKRIKELTASLEVFYRNRRPHSSTMFTQSQIPEMILAILTASQAPSKKSRLD